MWQSPLATKVIWEKDLRKQTPQSYALDTFRKQGDSVMNLIDFTSQRGQGTPADQERGHLILFMFWTMLISGYDYIFSISN